MAYHHRDIDEEIQALSIRFRDGEFSEDVYRASLKNRLSPADTEEIIWRDVPIRKQFTTNVRVLPPQAAHDLTTIRESIANQGGQHG